MSPFSTRNVVLLSGLLFKQTSADIPVHCLRHQVEGEWNFVIGKPSATRSSCGHRHPDVEDGQPARALIQGSTTTTQKFALKSPNLVTSPAGQKGTWTMVYDEGFEVRVDKRTFFAFSNFTYDDKGGKATTSHCGESMVGWYQNDDRTEFGCYYGSKVEPAVAVSTPATQQQNKSASYDKVVTHKAMTNKVAALNNKLNMLQLGWNARVIKKWVGKTPREINEYSGIRRATPMREAHKEMLKQSATAAGRPRSFLQKPAGMKLPESFDWGMAGADGSVDWLEPVMDQESCGSCYAASSMRMLSTRHKIKTQNQTAVPWSINMPLFCGEYNQGCKGGYPFLMAKWSSDVGLLPATYMRYDTSGSCKLEANLDKHEGKFYKAANHRYIGNYYGGTNEQLMMEELVKNGPITVAFEPGEDFMFYSDGIYRTAGLVNVTTGSMAPQEWEKTDHAVLLVGYGVEDGKKYWRIQNSWSDDWGEDGFFRMARGVDESAVESLASAADVVEDEQNGRQLKEFFKQMQH